MGFIADKQTLDDLDLLDRYSSGSIFALFNQVRTRGGELVLEKMFRNPLPGKTEINARAALFKYFQELNIPFPLDREQVVLMENFIYAVQQPNWVTALGQTIKRQALQLLGLREEYDMFIQGLRVTAALLRRLDVFFADVLKREGDNLYQKEIDGFQKFYKDRRLIALKAIESKERISPARLMRCTYLLGNVFNEDLLALLQLLYELDVFIAVGQVARKHGLRPAMALPPEEERLMIKNCRWPGLQNAIGNDILLDRSRNVLFLTGANMAGKSTLMKSVGAAVYLAHMGFPVAADEMEFSIKDGIFSSINVPDDISQGYSHFYAEVLRVKAVAAAVGGGSNVLVIFDELFKGTNVKDAYDATLAVTDAFAAFGNCAFIISTHILEVAAALDKERPNIRFSFLPTVMEDKKPVYTYRLEEGVSADRHGMMIIQQEGILHLLGGNDTTNQ